MWVYSVVMTARAHIFASRHDQINQELIAFVCSFCTYNHLFVLASVRYRFPLFLSFKTYFICMYRENIKFECIWIWLVDDRECARILKSAWLGVILCLFTTITNNELPIFYMKCFILNIVFFVSFENIQLIQNSFGSIDFIDFSNDYGFLFIYIFFSFIYFFYSRFVSFHDTSQK